MRWLWVFVLSPLLACSTIQGVGGSGAAGTNPNPGPAPVQFVVEDVNGSMTAGEQGPYCWPNEVDAPICYDFLIPPFDPNAVVDLPVDGVIRISTDPVAPPLTLTVNLFDAASGSTAASGTLSTVTSPNVYEWTPGVASGDYQLHVSGTWYEGADSTNVFSVRIP